MTLAEIEKTAILSTLEQCQWHQIKAAEALGISDRTIRNKIRAYREQGTYIPHSNAAKCSTGNESGKTFREDAA